MEKEQIVGFPAILIQIKGCIFALIYLNKMQRLSQFFLILLSTYLSSQEVINPIKWSFSHELTSDSTATLNFEAKIDNNWHLYSQYIENEPPLPTVFLFDNEPYSSIKKLREGKSVTFYDPIFEKDLNYFENYALFQLEVEINDSIDSIPGTIEFQACDDKLCVFRSEPFNFIFNKKVTSKSILIDEKSKSIANSLKLDLTESRFLKNNQTNNPNKSNWTIFLLGMFGGILALLTPCVFPMIPLTVSYFLKNYKSRSKGIKDSLTYSFFIILIYVLLSLPFHLFDSLDPEILNSIATSAIVNLIFFFVFVFFAFSFFGFYDLTLPSRWSNLSDSASSKWKGVLGLFFMALTLSIVSFSCTGPILGSLLAGSLTSDGGAIQLSFGMLGFGIALAFPFGLFSLFPKSIKLIPKSGTWLNTTNIVIGFIELALALKFLSNADLVSHWGILKREVFVSIWAVISFLTSLYLFGVFHFPHEVKHKIKILRKLIGSFFVLFTIYLIHGLLVKENNLKLLSGFPPPIFYSLNKSTNECPLNLNCNKDFFDGKVLAQKLNKPILVDFTGWACVNCRRMEENVWSDPEVFKILNNDIVLVSLYVDDRTELKDENQFSIRRTNGSLKKIKTIGQKWSTFQYLNFKTASQPFYVLMTYDGKVLNEPIQYVDKNIFKDWLNKGLGNFNKTIN